MKSSERFEASEQGGTDIFPWSAATQSNDGQVAPAPAIACPLSPFFIDYLCGWLDSRAFEGRWVDQVTESLNSNVFVRNASDSRLQRLILNPDAQQAIGRAAEWVTALSNSPNETLDWLHERVRFIAVVGAPRTGGSYLTAELLSAFGCDPARVPAVIAHDGFPEAQPFSKASAPSRSLRMVSTMAEFLTLIELFYQIGDGSTRVIVPKKLTKLVYSGGFFQTVLGDDATYLVTIRNPVASCVSTYEKSGGLPPDGRFAIRSAIERWILRDNLRAGVSRAEVAELGYFDAYIRYWEQYHIQLCVALHEPFARESCQIIPYGARTMEAVSNGYLREFDVTRRASPFYEGGDAYLRHPSWKGRAELAMQRVALAWEAFGMRFPMAELECAT